MIQLFYFREPSLLEFGLTFYAKRDARFLSESPFHCTELPPAIQVNSTQRYQEEHEFFADIPLDH